MKLFLDHFEFSCFVILLIYETMHSLKHGNLDEEALFPTEVLTFCHHLVRFNSKNYPS